MFVGRHNELGRLETLYGSDKFECVVLHGRWRVGTTSLIREFAKKKNAIYFAAQVTSGRENLANFVNCVQTALKDEPDMPNYFESFDDVLDYIFSVSVSKRIVLAIDDYHYLETSIKNLSESIGSHIDLMLKGSKLMLILGGSTNRLKAVGTLGYDSVFHGRRTAEIELEPFSFNEVRRYYRDFTPFDIAVIYGVTGGVPRYLELFDPQLPIEENIRRAIFDPSSFLFEEPLNILRKEIRDPAYYNAVLRAIAEGHRKNSEIAAAVNLETGACTGYLKSLINMGLVEKHTPVTEKAGKRTVYEINDHMFRFWYRFVPMNYSLIQSSMSVKIWREVSKEIPVYMGKVFEDICRQWLTAQNMADKLPIKFAEIGRWWGPDPVWKTEAELPIVAYADNDNAIFADCFWSEEPAHDGALISLAERSRLFPFSNRYLYLFSRSGFSQECADTAKRFGANLVMFE